jgi:hypothetical protein
MPARSCGPWHTWPERLVASRNPSFSDGVASRCLVEVTGHQRSWAQSEPHRYLLNPAVNPLRSWRRPTT